MPVKDLTGITQDAQMLSVVKYLFRFGNVIKGISLRREENVLIGITQAPYIMGLADGFNENDIPHKLISEGNCTGYHLPAKQTITLIEQNQLWRDAFFG